MPEVDICVSTNGISEIKALHSLIRVVREAPRDHTCSQSLTLARREGTLERLHLQKWVSEI